MGRRRGLGSASPETRRRVGRAGNAALRAAGRIYRWDPETARAAAVRSRERRGRLAEPVRVWEEEGDDWTGEGGE